MRHLLALLALSPLACPAAEQTATIVVNAPWDTIVNFLSGNERTVLAWCHCRLVTADEAMEFTANEPREIEVTIPKHEPIHLIVKATLKMKSNTATWEMELVKPAGGLKSYTIIATCEGAADWETSTIKIKAVAESDGRWKHWELAAGLSRTVKGCEAGMKQRFPGEK